MDNKNTSPLNLMAKLSGQIHLEAKKRDYITNDAIMVEALTIEGAKYVGLWLSDSEFYSTFKGNMVGYYLGIAVNSLAGGLSYADAWAYGDDRLSKIKYDEIYEAEYGITYLFCLK